jgi:hypothetical protein
MSRDWTQDELQRASAAMKAAGHMGYEEFCEALGKDALTALCKDEKGNLIKIENFLGSKNAFREVLERDFAHLKIITVLSQEDIDFIRDILK